MSDVVQNYEAIVLRGTFIESRARGHGWSVQPPIDRSFVAFSLLLAVGCSAADNPSAPQPIAEDAATAEAATPDAGTPDTSTDASADAKVDASADAPPDAPPPPRCASVDGTHDPAIVKMAANVTGDGRSIATIMTSFPTPGVSVAYRDANGMVHTAVFGNANNASFDANAPPLSSSTLFQAGSVSKPVSALAYLMASFADATLPVDIRPSVAGLVAPSYAISPAMLLTHTAGTTPHGYGGYAPGAQLPTVDQIVQGVSPSNSPPVGFGTPGAWSYSGGGLMLWNAWLNRETGTSLPAFVHDTLFVPAGATRSSYDGPLPMTEHDAACGHDPNRLGNACRFSYPEYAAAGLWTTPKDLTCIGGYVARMRTDVLTRVTSQSIAIPSYPQRQGLALRHRPANGVDETQGHFFEHSGVNFGFCTTFLFFSDGRAVATMDNSCQGVAYVAARAMCRELGWPCAGANLAAR